MGPVKELTEGTSSPRFMGSPAPFEETKEKKSSEADSGKDVDVDAFPE